MDKFNKILPTALVWRSRGDLVAIATVTETWGSSPRPVGSQMIINNKGKIYGSVSGGCVEGAVIEEAMYCIKTGKSLSLNYNVNDEDAFAAKLTCGGSIKILIQSIDACFSIDTLRTLVSKIDKNEAVGYVIDNINGENQLILADNEYSESFENGSGFINNKFFVVYPLPLKMLIIGGVHIAQFLSEFASVSGFEVTVIDPRPVFVTKTRFPNIKVMNSWPDEALKSFELNDRTAVVTLSHDPKIDDLALLIVLNSSCFYIGCLGSAATHQKRLERFKDKGYPSSFFKRLHGPIGLSINADTNAEIAVSIMGEIIKVLRNK